MPTGPGPRQRRATKIANRSHVTPFDRLAQWNAQIMNLGAQGSIPSIVGNTLQFVKLNASSIPGIMDNPATEDLDMNSFGIIRANRLEVDSNPAGTPSVSIIGGQSATLSVKSTNTALIEMEGPVNTIIRGNSKLNIETVGTLALQSLGANGTIVMGNSSLALMDLTGTQISLDAGTTGLQLSSDAGVTIDAATDFEIDTGGILDLSGNQIVIDASSMTNGVGVNISAANAITMDADNIDVEATTKLDLSGTNITINSSNNLEVLGGATLDLSSDNTKLNGTTTLDITGSTIDMRYDVSMNVTQDISTNEIWIKNIGGSGYARERENDSGFPYQGGWPASGTLAGNNTIFKIGRWVDYGGLAAVNMFTLPNTGPWPTIAADPGADGRGLIGMNLRSTYNYFLKRFAQGDLNMQDYQVRQKSARFFDQTETWADTNINDDGDIGFVESSSASSNKSFVYYGNNDVITMKNPMSLSFSTRYAFGTDSGTLFWVSTGGSGGSLSVTRGTSNTLGQFRFIKPGSGSGPDAGSVSWASDSIISPGSGCLPKISLDGGNMIHSRNNIPQSGWIVGFIVMEGGTNTTFESYQASSSTATNGTNGNFGSLSFDIITGSIPSSGLSSTVVASNIHFHTLNGGTRTQRTMKTFRNAIRYDNITTGLGVRFKVTVNDPSNPTLWNFVSIKGNTLLIELLVIEDVKL